MRSARCPPSADTRTSFLGIDTDALEDAVSVVGTVRGAVLVPLSPPRVRKATRPVFPSSPDRAYVRRAG